MLAWKHHSTFLHMPYLGGEGGPEVERIEGSLQGLLGAKPQGAAAFGRWGQVARPHGLDEEGPEALRRKAQLPAIQCQYDMNVNARGN